MQVKIDASNIKTCGGLTHLFKIIKNFDSDDINLDVIGGNWLSDFPSKKNIVISIFKLPFRNIFFQELFKRTRLIQNLKKGDIIFSPGGTFYSKNIPYVSMSQNMLVFEDKERNRFPFSFTKIRYLLLEKIQLKSFKNASGIIYISFYAKKYIEEKYPILKSVNSIVIYHGISNDFRQKPKKQYNINKYTKDKPYTITYVSIVNYYKHQFNVINSIKEIRRKGYNVQLELIGPVKKSLKKKFSNALVGCESFVKYKGKIPYNEISKIYKNTDLFIFASTCENMPNILVEAMSAGLPILCSNYGPMPEILKDGGRYMDPISIESITKNLKFLLDNENYRYDISNRAILHSKQFSWKKTSKKTFDFIKSVKEKYETNITIL